MNTRRSIAVLFAAFAAAAVVPATAQATTLSVTASCESGASKFVCFQTTTGGTAPYTVKWKPIQNAYPRTPGAFTGSCSPGLVEMQVKVVDATGAVAKDIGSVACNAGPWP
jgi:aerobic-type carbon monoxide dehydrogenase small subunit (CoxS/CutS family)